MIRWIEPDWPPPAGVRAATTLRVGGFSKGTFAEFNPAAHVGDDSFAIAQNRRLLQKSLALPNAPVWLRQVHGVRVVRADRACGVETADASYTHATGVVCAVLTADCLPLLLCSRKGGLVAAVHGGWRGLLAGVIQMTLQAFDKNEVIAWLGPAIGPEHFEVGGEVRAAFVEKSNDFAAAFQARPHGKWLADIYAIAKIILVGSGIVDVYGGGFCTYADSKRFYSYRRDGVTGRMATLIWRE
ncbi:MAG: peptidoglycan editing factor PgeF [Pseudomonadota bacterium]